MASLFFTLIWEKSQNLLKHMILCFLFIEATSHGEIEKEVDNLLKQTSVVSGQLRQLSDTVAKFVKCKFCQKKFYKSLDDNDVSRENLATGRKKSGRILGISCHSSHSTSLNANANASRLFNASSQEK